MRTGGGGVSSNHGKHTSDKTIISGAYIVACLKFNVRNCGDVFNAYMKKQEHSHNAVSH